MLRLAQPGLLGPPWLPRLAAPAARLPVLRGRGHQERAAPRIAEDQAAAAAGGLTGALSCLSVAVRISRAPGGERHKK